MIKITDKAKKQVVNLTGLSTGYEENSNVEELNHTTR
jgi:hypothetical protein